MAICKRDAASALKIQSEGFMKVVYAGKDSKKRKAFIAKYENVIVLLHDNWDDYTYKTTFPTECRLNVD